DAAANEPGRTDEPGRVVPWQGQQQGAGGQMAPGAIVSQPDGGQIRGSDAAEPGRVVPWLGQQQGTGQTPQPGQANQQAQQPQLPAQPAGGQLPGRIDTSPGSGTVTS